MYAAAVVVEEERRIDAVELGSHIGSDHGPAGFFAVTKKLPPRVDERW